MKDTLLILSNPIGIAYRTSEIQTVESISKEHNINVKIVNLDDSSQVSSILEEESLSQTAGIIMAAGYRYKNTINNLVTKGMKLISNLDKMIDATNKWLMYVTLDRLNIPTPKSVLISTLHSEKQLIPKDYSIKLIETLGLPIVIKPAYGALGLGIVKTDTAADLVDLLGLIRIIDHRRQPLIAQELVKECIGESIRVLVINGECVLAVHRKNNDTWKSNSSDQPNVIIKKYEIDNDLKKICLDTCAGLEINYAGIDVFPLGNNKYSIGEVNVHPMITSILANANDPRSIVKKHIKIIMPHKFA